jgi:Cu/Zn superoxide dismutase
LGNARRSQRTRISSTHKARKLGIAKLLAAKHGVEIEFNISQLPPGVHGIHVHNVGKCERAGFHERWTALESVCEEALKRQS